MSITAGTKLGFRAGTQAALDAILVNNNTAVPGIFYLTSDTHRLYVGNDDHSLSPVNEGIITKASVSALTSMSSAWTDSQWEAAQGQFYYCDSENVLCVASGNRWVQINPDTYWTLAAGTDGLSTSVSLQTTGSGSSQRKIVTVTTATNEAKYVGGQRDTATALVPHETSFVIEGSATAGISVDSTNKKILIEPPAGAEYDLQGAAKSGGGVTLTLAGSNNTTDTIDIVKGTGCVITPTWTPGSPTNGHGSIGTITLTGSELSGADFDVSQDSNGNIILTLTSSDGVTVVETDGIKPVINYGNNGSGSTTATEVGDYDSATGILSFDLDVYTKQQTDDAIAAQLKTFEGMYFAGTIASANDIPTGQTLGSYRSGATFKVSQTITGYSGTPVLQGLSGTTIDAGDLIVITGSEDTNGNLNGTTVTYYYIPSGDDFDEYFEPNFATANQINITSHSGNSYQYSFAAGNNGVTVTGTSGDSTDQTLTISHKTLASAVTAPTPVAVTGSTSGDNNKFAAIDSVTVDDYGHVTALTAKEITFAHNRPADNTITATSLAATQNAGAGVSITNSLADTMGGSYESNALNITSQSLTIAQTATGTTSTPAAMTIDMVWGSF